MDCPSETARRSFTRFRQTGANREASDRHITPYVFAEFDALFDLFITQGVPAMQESNKFKANGAARMAFEATGGRIDYGVNAQGRVCGVYGESSGGFNRDIAFGGVGVWGDGLSEGVHGRGSIAPESIGVRGQGSAAGVHGECAEGVAIFGLSSRGRGGAFRSECAQVRLIPAARKDSETSDFGAFLPLDGQPGDLLVVTQDDGFSATLWFCERGRFKDRIGFANALWKQVTLGQGYTGQWDYDKDAYDKDA